MYWFVSGSTLFWCIHTLGLACFAYIVARRLTPLLQAEKDFRFDRPGERLGRVLKFWFGQWKHPRYRIAGTMHILIFSGFIVLAIHTFSLLGLGTRVAEFQQRNPVFDTATIWSPITLRRWSFCA